MDSALLPGIPVGRARVLVNVSKRPFAIVSFMVVVRGGRNIAMVYGY